MGGADLVMATPGWDPDLSLGSTKGKGHQTIMNIECVGKGRHTT